MLQPYEKPKFAHFYRSIPVIAMVVVGLLGMAYAVAQPTPPAQPSALMATVIDQARAAAKTSYEAPVNTLHQRLNEMNYQQYRAIRFEQDKALWRNERPYEIQFFHPGFLYQQGVEINTFSGASNVSPVNFNSDWFRYDPPATELAKLTDNQSGFAGFRVHYPINTAEYKDEFAVFLGASYFRLVGKHQVYGLSARGLAINTAEAEGEEFPRFTRFWLETPRQDHPLVIYALLDSPSVSGAYRFTLRPGETTQMSVSAWLFARESLTKLGIAPLTSMFLYGENSHQPADDYRPEVHDSDGVLMHTSKDEWLWRPLTNPKRLQVTSLSDTSPKGFGLLQRDTDFSSYLDGEASYHSRPGMWITPLQGFGAGRLELVEIPTQSETHDNIVNYWVPDQPFEAGQEIHLRYRIQTVSGDQLITPDTLASVVRTRQGSAILPGHKASQDDITGRRFVIDFKQSPGLESEKLTAQVSVSAGQARQVRVIPLDAQQLVRVTFVLTNVEKDAVDMRATLQYNDSNVSEVWNYVYQPN